MLFPSLLPLSLKSVKKDAEDGACMQGFPLARRGDAAESAIAEDLLEGMTRCDRNDRFSGKKSWRKRDGR